MTGGEPASAGSRLAAVRETAIVAALALAALWIIPRQTASGPVLGLPPAFLPTVCVWAILALALIGLALRLWKPEPESPARHAKLAPAALILGVAVAGATALHGLGAFACGLVVVTLGTVALGERRLPVLATTLAGTALALGAIFQPWR